MIKRILLIATCLMFMGTVAFGANESVTQNGYDIKNSDGVTKARIVKFTVVCDDAAATMTDTAINTALTSYIRGWYLDTVIVNPGTTAPTAASDIYLTNADGLDILGGSGVDLLDDADTTGCVPSVDGQNKQQLVHGVLTLDMDNNAELAATFTVTLIFVQP